MLIVTGLLAYNNSFRGAFIFDDVPHIVENLRLRHLWPLGPLLTGDSRPLVEFSLALNYALGDLQVWGYHALNLAIHLGAALTLYGLVRRTLLTQRLQARYRASATGLAVSVSLLWLIHPLQTQSVTYIIQRAEALTGLCYLLTLYCVLRSAISPRRSKWSAAAILACAAGMASKPVMVTAPLTVFLYDRTFLAGSLRQALQHRRNLYLGLFATWGFLGLLLMTNPHRGAGFDVKGMTPLTYAATQPGVLLHYLKLSFWPHPLCLDYAWPVVTTLNAVLLPTLLVGFLCVLTLWALWSRRVLGFLGAWFFLILAPTSSVIPVLDPAMEHRMYLPLAAVIIIIVMGAWHIMSRWIVLPVLRRGLALGLLLIITGLLGILTSQRNADYQSEIAIWRDTLAKRPNNPRAHTNVGVLLKQQGNLEEAVTHLTEALRLDPDYAEAHIDLGAVLMELGQVEEAIRHYTEALRLAPTAALAHYDLAVALTQQSHFEEAIAHLTEALRLKPEFAEAHNYLGVVLARQGRLDEAVAHFTEALRLKPDYPRARKNLEATLTHQSSLQQP